MLYKVIQTLAKRSYAVCDYILPYGFLDKRSLSTNNVFFKPSVHGMNNFYSVEINFHAILYFRTCKLNTYNTNTKGITSFNLKLKSI